MVDATYTCPHCGVVAHLERDEPPADESVTPYPLDGWTYSLPHDDPAYEAVDGIRLECGAGRDVEWDDGGCGEPFYVNFPKYVDGDPVEQRPSPEYVEQADGPKGPWEPRGPDRF